MEKKPIKIAVSAGELSGDEHAAQVVSALRRLLPEAEFKGMGGSKLRAAGVEIVVDSEKSGNVMGVSQVILSLPKIFNALSSFKNFIRAWRPDLLIVVDYPDFHFRVIPYAKKLGTPVLYFIPPTVWAWREGRIKKLRKWTDMLAVIYPFEEKFYQERDLQNVAYVGHPFAASLPPIAEAQEKQDILAKLGLDASRKTAALFPGSRRAEIRKNLANICEAFSILRSAQPDIQGVIARAPSIPEEFLRAHLPPSLEDIKISSESSLEILRAADGAVLKSGTSNLQAAFLDTPFVMTYSDSRFAKFLADRLVRLKEFSIVNIIRPGTIREIIGPAVSPRKIAEELERVIYDEARRRDMLKAFAEIRSSLSIEPERDSSVRKSPYELTADLAATLLKTR